MKFKKCTNCATFSREKLVFCLTFWDFLPLAKLSSCTSEGKIWDRREGKFYLSADLPLELVIHFKTQLCSSIMWSNGCLYSVWLKATVKLKEIIGRMDVTDMGRSFYILTSAQSFCSILIFELALQCYLPFCAGSIQSLPFQTL